MTKNYISRLLLAFTLIFLQGHLSISQTLKVWPTADIGTGVTYGADVKLTLFRIHDFDRMNQNFVNLGMDLVRVPVIAHWKIKDAKYNTITSYVSSAKKKGLSVFASVANTNGQFKLNGDLDDGHNGHKFPKWMKCTENGGTLDCLSDEKGLYGVNRTHYQSYLAELIPMLGDIDYIGPWNEDNASIKDYTMTDIDKPIVGSELWSLKKSAAEMKQVGKVIDLGGAHNYDDDGENGQGTLLDSYTYWKNFYNEGGDWFTESTRHLLSTSNGIGQILPAIANGMSKIIVYQTSPRIFRFNGNNNNKHYPALKALISGSKGKGSAKRVETDSENFPIACFVDSTDLIVHVCNLTDSTEYCYIDLQDQHIVDMFNHETETYGGNTAKVSYAQEGQQIKIELSGKTYAKIILKNLRHYE